MSVIHCNDKYENTPDLNEHFDVFPFELDHFQKYAIEAIVSQKHVLVTAHTGSGKTVPAEFAIQHFVKSMDKKVIYTSPIKSLSNQKFHELSKQFPEISFGLLTGDIKSNPEAECLIVTTEILRNMIYTPENNNYVDLDVRNDIGCVIFDEVHYINDQHRGHVWEECISNLPKNIQMVLLSATIDKPHIFAKWVAKTTERDIYYATTSKRVVPLTHYSYISFPDSTQNKLQDKKAITLLERMNNQQRILKSTGHYHQKPIDEYRYVNKYVSLATNTNTNVHTIKTLVKTLRDTNKLPAICFVFSRKKAEFYANKMEINLHDGDCVENDVKKGATVEKECSQIVRQMANHQEIVNTPEYINAVNLLKKGIAVHHSGVIPVIREMIELLFSKGYVKLLFATETFSVGINMPTKTVIFTSLYKFDGEGERLLYPHEYTQMAGRAGRRGLDKVGHVIHLNGLFDIPGQNEYTHLLSGKSQLFKSKYNISPLLILRLMNKSEETDVKKVYDVIQTSFMNHENKGLMKQCKTELIKVEDKLDCYRIYQNTSYLYESFNDYNLLPQKGKKTEQVRRRISEYLLTCSIGIDSFNNALSKYNELFELERQRKQYIQEIHGLENAVETEVDVVFQFLEKQGLIEVNHERTSTRLTKKGVFSTYTQEMNTYVLSDLYLNGWLHKLSSVQMTMLLCCFCNVNVSVRDRIYEYESYDKKDKVFNTLLKRMEMLFSLYEEEESLHFTTYDDSFYFYQYDFIDSVKGWYYAGNEQDAKSIIQDCSNYNVYTGDFSKMILKVNAMVQELNSFCEYADDMELKKILEPIQENTLKYIVTNQSLYV